MYDLVYDQNQYACIPTMVGSTNMVVSTYAISNQTVSLKFLLKMKVVAMFGFILFYIITHLLFFFNMNIYETSFALLLCELMTLIIYSYNYV